MKRFLTLAICVIFMMGIMLPVCALAEAAQPIPLLSADEFIEKYAPPLTNETENSPEYIEWSKKVENGTAFEEYQDTTDKLEHWMEVAADKGNQLLNANTEIVSLNHKISYLTIALAVVAAVCVALCVRCFMLSKRIKERVATNTGLDTRYL